MGINSFKQWEGEDLGDGRSNASVSELKHLSHLSALDIHVPDANLLPTNLFSDKLVRYTILVGDCWDYPDIYGTSSNMLKLKLTTRNQFDRGIKLLVKRCEHLYVDGIEGVNIISYLFDSDTVKQLKHLHVQNNDEVTYVINSVSCSYSHNAFPNLESLTLYNLVSLESVCYGQLVAEPFQNLKSLKLRNLPKLTGFSSNGKQLRIDTEADEIISEDEIGGAERLFTNGEASISIEPALPLSKENKEIDSKENFETLAPYYLFDEKVGFPSLDKLIISDLPQLKTIFYNKLDPDSFGKLRRIEVYGCDGLISIFGPSITGRLNALTKLCVENCQSLQVVFETTVTEFEFPKVAYVRFENLPQLRSFSPVPRVSKWPLLKELYFIKCGNVEIFASGISRFQRLEGLPAPIKKPFFLIDKGSFSNLEYLCLDDNTKIFYEPYGPLPADFFSRLRYLNFSPAAHPKIFNFLQKLQKLESLLLRSAPWKEIFVQEGKDFVTLPHVKTLWLGKMPELMHLGNGHPHPADHPVFPYLNDLSVYDCGQLKNLSPSVISFKSLMRLSLYGCHTLEYVTTYSIAESLKQLTSMKVLGCEKMVALVASDGDDSENEIAFSQLQHLELCYLPSLQGICSGNCVVKVPSLDILIVDYCRIKLRKSPDGLLLCDSTPERLQITEESDGSLLTDSRLEGLQITENEEVRTDGIPMGTH